MEEKNTSKKKNPVKTKQQTSKRKSSKSKKSTQTKPKNETKAQTKTKSQIKEETIEKEKIVEQKDESKKEKIIKQEETPKKEEFIEPKNDAEFFDILNEKKKEWKPKKKNTINKEEYYDILEHEKSHFLLKFLFFIILLAIGFFIVYKFVIRDTKSMFSSGINTLYEKAANNIVKISRNDIFNEKIKVSGVLKLNTTNEEYDDFNNHTYDVNFNADKINHNYNLGITINNLEGNFISSVDYYYLNNNFYLNLGNNFNNKTIKLDEDIFNINSNLFGINKIDFNKLNTSVKSIKNIINSNIDREKLSLGNQNINGSDYEYVSLKLSNAEFATLVSKIIDDIKNNSSLVDNLSSSFNVSNEIVTKYLDSILKNNLTNQFNYIEFKCYVSGFMANVAGYEINIDNNKVFYYLDDEITLKYKEYDLTAKKINDKYNVTIDKNNDKFITLVFNELNEDTIDIDYKYLENNSYGNIHYNKYKKNSDKSGNISFSLVDKNNVKYSIYFDYVIDNIYDIKASNIINVSDLTEDDIDNTNKNINYSLKNTIFKQPMLDIFEKAYKQNKSD